MPINEGILALGKALTAIAPKIRGPIQLAGLLFTTLAIVLISNLDPDNTTSIAISGGIGVALITIPLAFRTNILNSLPERHRMAFLLLLILLLLSSFSGLAYLTNEAFKMGPSGARFDMSLKAQDVHFRRLGDEFSMVDINWKVFSLAQNSSEGGATVFIGIVIIHDADKISNPGFANVTSKPCDQVSSCIGVYVFKDFSRRPVFVPSGADFHMPGSIKIKDKGTVKKVRIYWEFYQREGQNGNICKFDNDYIHPEGGLPYLAMYNSQGEKVGRLCYLSMDRIEIPVLYN